MKGSSLIFLVVVVVVLYAVMILPQRRQQKQKAEMMKKLGPGSKVLTASGIYAQIVEMQDNVVVAKIADGVEVELDPRAVVRVVEAAEPQTKPETAE